MLVAQAMATIASLSPDRVILGVGTGESLNEVPATGLEWPGFKDIYDVYSHKVMPQMGKLIAQDEESYRYLAESIRRFPPMPEFEQMIRDAGFANTRVEPIFGGAVAIHSGWKI